MDELPSVAFRKITGWVVIIVTFLVIGFWSYWGINEAFHEGWYYPTLGENLLLTVSQYILVPLLFTILSLIALRHKTAGLLLFIASGIFAFFFFSSPSGRFIVSVPLILLGLGYSVGFIHHKRLLFKAYPALFCVIIIAFGIPHFIRVAQRVNDRDFGMRTVVGNGITLTWAPRGNGFPATGTDWKTAYDSCSYLAGDGVTLSDSRVNQWRLPTREEIVKSLTRKGENAEGEISNSQTARFVISPDKETPLWDPLSPIIYYWTRESADSERAFLVAYNGVILQRSKTAGPAYQGYRCVRAILNP